MIGGCRVANEDKILSLYDGSVNVIKRGKAEAAVEFGNKLWLGENRDGIFRNEPRQVRGDLRPCPMKIDV